MWFTDCFTPGNEANAGIADQVQISQFGFLCISEAILGYNLTEMSTMLSQYNTTVTDHTTLKNQV